MLLERRRHIWERNEPTVKAAFENARTAAGRDGTRRGTIPRRVEPSIRMYWVGEAKGRHQGDASPGQEQSREVHGRGVDGGVV